MLILTRKVGQTLQIGSAKVTIKSVRGKAVSLTIRAPRDVRVVRSELSPNGENGAQQK